MAEKSFFNPTLAYVSSISFFITALFNAILTIWKEEDKNIYNWLAATFGHHWVGHGIILLVLFIVLTIILSFVIKTEEIDEKKITIMIALVLLGSILSVLIIGGYFWMHFAAEA